jgi:hypothetical protein
MLKRVVTSAIALILVFSFFGISNSVYAANPNSSNAQSTLTTTKHSSKIHNGKSAQREMNGDSWYKNSTSTQTTVRQYTPEDKLGNTQLKDKSSVPGADGAAKDPAFLNPGRQ